MDVSQIETKLKALKPVFGADGADNLEFDKDRNTVSMSYRNWSLFTDREGEEDDDWPNFTGAQLVDRILKMEFPNNKYSFSADEKKWFTVTIHMEGI